RHLPRRSGGRRPDPGPEWATVRWRTAAVHPQAGRAIMRPAPHADRARRRSRGRPARANAAVRSPVMAADRDLLFGLLALQVGLIDQGQLVAAFQAWTRDKGRPLADHLVSRGGLAAEQRA